MTTVWRHLEAVRLCLESLDATPQPDPVDEADAVALIAAEQARLALLRQLLAETMAGPVAEMAAPTVPVTTRAQLRELLLLVEGVTWDAGRRHASAEAIGTHQQWRRTA